MSDDGVLRPPDWNVDNEPFLQAAWEICDEQSVEHVTLESVAERAGVSLAAIQRTLPTRRHLFAEMAIQGVWGPYISEVSQNETPSSSARCSVARFSCSLPSP